MSSIFKVVRVVTASYVVPWHLDNTLPRLASDFEVTVVGQDVSSNAGRYANVRFVDININRKTSYVADIVALFKLCQFLLTYRPDIVHSIMPKAGLLAALAGFICRVPIRIHTFTGQTWAGKTGPGFYLHWILDRLINLLNTACLTDSFSQSQFLLHHKITNSGSPLPVLSRGSLSGIDLTRFEPDRLAAPAAALRLTMGIAPEDFVFAYIARKTREKGAIDVLVAFSRVHLASPETLLLFVGPDEDGEITKLRESKPDLFSGVIDVGHVNDHEVYLAAADVLCLPSYREGFGSIVIDAAAMGVPAIGSRIPGLVDAVVEGKTGFLFGVGDVGELETLMQSLFENRPLVREMGRQARQRVEKSFTADHLYAALKEFYLQCASKSRKTRIKSELL